MENIGHQPGQHHPHPPHGQERRQKDIEGVAGAAQAAGEGALLVAAGVAAILAREAEARQSARRALLVNVFGGTLLGLGALVERKPRNLSFEEAASLPTVQDVNAIGLPASVPVGRYTKGVLEEAKLWSAIEPKM